MSIKLKPSTKEYKRDSRGKIISDKQYTWKHYPPCSFKLEELVTMYESTQYKRKKHLILNELQRRGYKND